MSGKTNIVIGAGSGIGASVAELLAPAGSLLVADINLESVEGVAAKYGGIALSCDITNEKSIRALAKNVDELGALIITAGLSPSMATGKRIVEVNLCGVRRVLDIFEDCLVAGSVAVCVASMAAHMNPPLDSALARFLDDPQILDHFDSFNEKGINLNDAPTAYGYSKLGVIRTCRSRAASWGKVGARIVSVSPGIVNTSMGQYELESQAAMKELIAISPLARMGLPEEIAQVICFLASPQASFVTGCDLLVDGGVMSLL